MFTICQALRPDFYVLRDMIEYKSLESERIQAEALPCTLITLRKFLNSLVYTSVKWAYLQVSCAEHKTFKIWSPLPLLSHLSAQEASVPTNYVLGHNRFFLFSLALQVQVPFPHCRMFFPLFTAVMNSQVISLRKALESLESFPLPIASCRLSTYFAELLIFFLVCLSF